MSDDRIHDVSEIEDPAVRRIMEHVRDVKDLGRQCALMDLLDLAMNESMPMQDRNLALRLLAMDVNGKVDQWRNAYMDVHDGKDGTELEDTAKEVARAT